MGSNNWGKQFLTVYTVIVTALSMRGETHNDANTNSFPGGTPSDYLDFTFQIANNHIWRGIEVSDGLVMCNSLGIHDIRDYVKVGMWGGTNVTGNYKEFNFFAEFSVQKFSVAFWDTYNFSKDATYNNKEFFNYKARSTGRFLDCIVSYNFDPIFPLSLTWSTIIWGRDRYALYLPDSKQRYSTYVAAEVRCLDKQNWVIDASVGGTFTLAHKKLDKTTFYSARSGIIDIRGTVTRIVRITDNYTLPVHTTVMFNPVGNNAYFQVGAVVFSF
ncbi:MAG: hypothetical protein HDR88_13495 [Bacteroides sp.]|nr:hypothetical protein [Bacteroides sp.]